MKGNECIDKRDACTGRCFAGKTSVAMFKGTIFGTLGNTNIYLYHSYVCVLTMEPELRVH